MKHLTENKRLLLRVLCCLMVNPLLLGLIGGTLDYLWLDTQQVLYIILPIMGAGFVGIIIQMLFTGITDKWFADR